MAIARANARTTRTEDGALLRVTVKDADEAKVGRAFTNAAIELALANYPGFHVTAPPSGASPYGVYWPALVPAMQSIGTCSASSALR